MSKSSATDEDQFDWVQFKKDYAVSNVETKKEKLLRKIKENPLVPIGMEIHEIFIAVCFIIVFVALGCAATTVALGMGLWNFRKGDSKMSQTMMRVRIGAQGFTVFALIVGVAMTMAKSSS